MARMMMRRRMVRKARDWNFRTMWPISRRSRKPEADKGDFLA